MKTRDRIQAILRETTPPGGRHSDLLNAHTLLVALLVLIAVLTSALSTLAGNQAWAINGPRLFFFLWATCVLLSTLWTLGSVRPRVIKDPSMLGQRLTYIGRFLRGFGLLAAGAWFGIYAQKMGEYLDSQAGLARSGFMPDGITTLEVLTAAFVTFAPFAALYVGLVLAWDMVRVRKAGRLRAAGSARAVLNLFPRRVSRSRLARFAPYWIFDLSHPLGALVASVAYMVVFLR